MQKTRKELCNILEQIYTIPVNEAFDAVVEHPEDGCPFCKLYKKLEEDELEIILGASMMEPDIRIKTNEEGFCHPHYRKMLKRKRMLGMGLMMESHLDVVEGKLDGKGVFGAMKTASIPLISRLEEDCYVCGRINKNMRAMIATAVYLFETERDFRKKLEKMPFFCLPHYRMMLEYALKKTGKRTYADLFDTAHGIQKDYMKTLKGDVSWFCKKFDYRYDEEPWYNSKDSVQRSIKFLAGVMGEDD